MSYQRRDALVEEIVQLQPTLRPFVRDLSTDLMAGSWDLVSYSFERGFEALWDLARADSSGLLERPLLSLWRQSVELAIKSAILDLVGEIRGKPGHDLDKLFQQLLNIRAAEGFVDDDDLARNVRSMIGQVQAFDPFADRFRYPSDRSGKGRVPGRGVGSDGSAAGRARAFHIAL